MKYLVAVSGGVDSVVLLDMLSRTDHHLIVAHVDHGIRPESGDDAAFVRGLAERYHLPLVTTECALGAGASEETARVARYDFLFEQACKHGATIVTAHHLDDLVETVALNINRGTGWRGLSVLNRSGIYRPLLALSKSHLYHYAMQHGLEWVEDASNHTDRYLRNRLRHKLATVVVDMEAVAKLRTRQIQLKKDIVTECLRIMTTREGSRHFLGQLEDSTATELLGYVIERRAGRRPTRPQLARALIALKTAKPTTIHQLGDGVELAFTTRKYTVRVV